MAESSPIGMLQQMAGGYCVARCLHLVVELGVPDALGDQPQDAGTLAAAVGAHGDALKRALRLLAGHGVFALEHGRFTHTAASRLLRKDHPESARDFVRLFGMPLFWDAYGVLGHSLRTGRPAAELLQPEGLPGWLARNPEAAATFEEARASRVRAQVAGVLDAHDFSGFQLIGDIAGGQGHLLRAVLQAHPGTKGILFDRPEVVAAVGPVPGMARQGGDVYRDPLPSCDAYLLMDVIHDCEEDQALCILMALRRAAPPGAKLLLIEAVIPDAPGADWARMMDVHMLALSGGRQRTADEYAYLLRSAGFGLLRTIETRSPVSILEAIAR